MTTLNTKTFSKGEGKNFDCLNPKQFDRGWYHSGCPDGIGGMYPFWRENKTRLPQNDLNKMSNSWVINSGENKPFWITGVKYNEPYPKFNRGDRIILVDFSYNRETIKKICLKAGNLLILDHHDTNLRELKDLEKELDNFAYVFDLKRSGAQIAWDWCYNRDGHRPKRPWFIEIIADRDLWKWEIPNSKIIGKALYHFGWYHFDRMEELYTSKKSTEELKKKFLTEGTVLSTIENKDVTYAVATSNLCWFQGYTVHLTTCHPTLRSEIGNILANRNDSDFSAIWRYDFERDQWWISLRASKSCNIPLNIICEKFGGGGHIKACGFTIHGPNSKEWINAKDKRLKMAHGSIHDYFKRIDLYNKY